MGWGQVVHENRKRAELARAREELRRRRRGYDIVEAPSAGIPALLTLASALSGAIWWKREGRKLQGRDWRHIPGVQQFLDLLNGSQQPSRTAVRGKSKPKASAKAAVLKAAAAKPSNASSRPQQSAPQAAAAAAAMQRQAASTGQSSSSSRSAAPTGTTSKKKKAKKKR